MSVRRPLRRTVRLVLGLSTALVILGVAELCLRALGDPLAGWQAGIGRATGIRLPAEGAPSTGSVLQLDPVLGWTAVPGARVSDPVLEAWNLRFGLGPVEDPGVINDLGLRDDPIDLPGPPGERRVLCLGDSSVWGFGVPWSTAFPQRLEAALTPGVQVIDGGVPGYSSYQSLALWERLERRGVQAEGLIAYLGNSDSMPSRGGQPDREHFGSPLVRSPVMQALGRLSLVRWSWAAALAVQAPPAAGSAVRVEPAELADNLRRLAERAAARGAWLIIVVPPQPEHAAAVDVDYRVRSEEEARAARATLAAPARPVPAAWHFRLAISLAAWESGAGLLDGDRLFRQARAADPEAYRDQAALFVDSIHPSSTGHALLAEALLPMVRERMVP